MEVMCLTNDGSETAEMEHLTELLIKFLFVCVPVFVKLYVVGLTCIF